MPCFDANASARLRSRAATATIIASPTSARGLDHGGRRDARRAEDADPDRGHPAHHNHAASTSGPPSRCGARPRSGPEDLRLAQPHGRLPGLKRVLKSGPWHRAASRSRSRSAGSRSRSPSDLAPGEVTPLTYWNRELVLWRDDAGDVPPPGRVLPAPRRAPRRTAARCAATSCSARSTAGGTTATARARTSRTASAPTARRSCARTRRSCATGSCSRGTTRTKNRRSGRSRSSRRSAIPAWSDFYSSSYVIHTVPQEMSENGADPAHFQYVHGTDDVAEMESTTPTARAR